MWTSAAQLHVLNEACRDLYRLDLTLENFATRTFSFMSRLVPAELFAFGAYDCGSKQMDIRFSSGVPGLQPAMEAFARLMGGYELFNWDPKVNGGKPFCRSDWFSAREYRDQTIYQEVGKVLGVDNHCAVYVPGGPGEVAFFGFERSGGRDFTAEERALLELAQPHLGNARDLALARAQYGQEFQASPQALMRAGLTTREADVLAWLAEGKSNDEIALLLHLQLWTVKGYVKTIFQKIGAPNRLAAALWALKESWRHQRLAAAAADRPENGVRVASSMAWAV